LGSTGTPPTLALALAALDTELALIVAVDTELPDGSALDTGALEETEATEPLRVKAVAGNGVALDNAPVKAPLAVERARAVGEFAVLDAFAEAAATGRELDRPALGNSALLSPRLATPLAVWEQPNNPLQAAIKAAKVTREPVKCAGWRLKNMPDNMSSL
jgi:hypothetical protein